LRSRSSAAPSLIGQPVFVPLAVSAGADSSSKSCCSPFMAPEAAGRTGDTALWVVAIFISVRGAFAVLGRRPGAGARLPPRRTWRKGPEGRAHHGNEKQRRNRPEQGGVPESKSTLGTGAPLPISKTRPCTRYPPIALELAAGVIVITVLAGLITVRRLDRRRERSPLVPQEAPTAPKGRELSGYRGETAAQRQIYQGTPRPAVDHRPPLRCGRDLRFIHICRPTSADPASRLGAGPAYCSSGDIKAWSRGH